MPINRFKQQLTEAGTTYGIFVSLADPVCAEISARAGFDWIIIDTEHAPNDLRDVLVQLQAVEAVNCDVMVRPMTGDRTIIKRLLDVGAQTILAPMVDTAEEAAELVASLRYPPEGKRGVAGGRAAGWGRVDGYFTKADAQTCLVAQIETVEGLRNIEAISAVDGVDALFVGPSDLAASLGFLGQAGHPDVVAAVVDALERIVASGKPAGVYAATTDMAATYEQAGASFITVGVDTYILATSTSALAELFLSDRA